MLSSLDIKKCITAMRPEHNSSPSSDLRCILCKRADETEITGPLSCKLNIAAHQNCLLYASGIYCKYSPTYDDLFGFDVKDVEKESKRGRKLKCAHCKHCGATAGCEVKSCKHTYHYPCAIEAHAIPNEDSYRLYCALHNPHTNNVGSKERDAGATPSGSGLKRSHRNEQNSSPGESGPTRSSQPASPEPSCSVVSLSTKLHSPSFVLLFPLSDSDTLRSQNKKRKCEESCSDSDETQSILDPVFAPVESELEDTPPRQNTQSLESDSRSRDNKEPRQEVASAPNGDGGGDDDDDDDGEIERDMVDVSQSLLPEYLEDVPFTVIAHSGPSVESVAENSFDPFSPAPSPADTALDQPVSAPEQGAALHSNITVLLNPPVSAHPSLDSPPFGDSSNAKKASCKDLPAKAECCASPDIPPTLMTDELPGSHVKRLNDKPLDLTAPAGCSNVQVSEPVGHLSISDSGATLFWRRCNEVGCTEAIFTELKRQLFSLAERVQNQHATQDDYAVSLRMLKASGKLPAIFRQMEKDLEDQERLLQKKREALGDAKAVLDENQLI